MFDIYFMGTECIKAAKIEPCCILSSFLKNAFLSGSTYQHNAPSLFVPPVTLTRFQMKNVVWNIDKEGRCREKPEKKNVTCEGQ